MDLIVNFTPTGMIPTKKLTPHVPVNSVAIACGGGVRVGLEDNIFYDSRRTKLACNADLLRRVHILADANEKEVMSPGSLRKLLNLEPGNGRYGRQFHQGDGRAEPVLAQAPSTGKRATGIPS